MCLICGLRMFEAKMHTGMPPPVSSQRCSPEHYLLSLWHPEDACLVPKSLSGPSLCGTCFLNIHLRNILVRANDRILKAGFQHCSSQGSTQAIALAGAVPGISPNGPLQFQSCWLSHCGMLLGVLNPCRQSAWLLWREALPQRTNSKA